MQCIIINVLGYTISLHHVNKEILALRSACFSHRYAEQVIPLLVLAQRKVIERINQSNGPAPPQPQFRALMAKLGHLVTARDYLTMQLTISSDLSPADRVTIYGGSTTDKGR